MVFNRDGFLGLELQNFERSVWPELEALRHAAENLAVRAEPTVVAPFSIPTPNDFAGGFPETVSADLPTPPPLHRGEVAIHFDESEDGRAGTFARPTADLLPTMAAPVPPVPRPRRPIPNDTGSFPSMEAPAVRRRPPAAEAPAATDAPPPQPLDLDGALGDPEDAPTPTVEPIAPEHLRDVLDGIDSALPTIPGPTPAPAGTAEALGLINLGTQALSETGVHLPRATPNGSMTLSDPIDLLGLYLSAIRHRCLTVFGGPAAEPGDPFDLEIRIPEPLVVTVTAVARVGDWLTLSVDAPEAVARRLSATKDRWWPTVEQLAHGASGGASEPSSKSAGRGGSAPNLQPAHPEPPAILQLGGDWSSADELSPDFKPNRGPEQRSPSASGADAERPDRVADIGSPSPAGGASSTSDLIDAIFAEATSDDDDDAVAAETTSSETTATAEAMAEPEFDELELDGAESVEPEPDAPAPPAPFKPIVTALADEPAGPAESASEPKPSHEPEPKAAPECDDESDKAATVPRLEEDLVVFETREDLDHEMGANLKNGGLFVASDPVPIRTKRRLRVRVGQDVLPVVLETDVVFSDGGRVGFSVANTPAAQQQLQQYLDGKLDTAQSPRLPQTGGLSTLDVDDLNADAVSSADVHTFAGTISDAPENRELLRLQQTQIDDPAQLSSVSILHLFEYIVRQQWKGVLTVEKGDETHRIWMHEGSVAYIESKPYEEQKSLGRILIGLKKVTEVHLRDGLEKAKKSQRSLGRTLVLLGVVKRTDITAALREQVRLKMDACFGWSTGRYEWTPWTEPPGQADLVLTRGIGVMARHIRNRLDHLSLADVEDLFGRGLSRTVAHASDVDQIATSLQLAPRDLRFLELQVDGTKSAHDAVTGSPLGRLASLRLVALGLVLGFVRYTDQAAPRQRTSTGTDAAGQAAKKLIAKLKDRLSTTKQQNHFDRLGVHWSAHHRTYRAAYEAAAEEFNLSRPPLKDAPNEARGLAKQIRAELDSAFKALNDSNQRPSYRKQLFDSTEREYAADMLVKQGEVALMRGDRVQAIECLETAVELSATPRNRALLKSARGGRA